MDTDMSTKNDTIRLAGHCDAGCKMAIDSMDQISRYVTDDNLRNVIKYSLQGTTQGNGLTGGLPPVRFSM